MRVKLSWSDQIYEFFNGADLWIRALDKFNFDTQSKHSLEALTVLNLDELVEEVFLLSLFQQGNLDFILKQSYLGQ